MAYGLRYQCGWHSYKDTQAGYVYIYQEGYSGAVENLILKAGGLKIEYVWGDWENPIIGLRCSFEIVNNKTDFYELLPLITANEREYFIKVERIEPSASVMSMFEGYINCKDNEEGYYRYSTIRIYASSYLSKLKYVTPDSIDVWETDFFINVINNCLNLTGSSYNIRVNSSLLTPDDDAAIGVSARTLFNLSGVHHEIFWDDNIERNSSFEIITKILKSFDCYIYWYDGYWYIERYADLWSETKNYVEYDHSVTYDYATAGTWVEETVTAVDFVDYYKLRMSQRIGMTPGKKQIEINLNQQDMFNLLLNDYSDIVAVADPPAPWPDLRQWEYKDGTNTFTAISNYKTIKNGIWRTIFTGDVFPYTGLYTRFRMTVSDNTSLTLSFKYALDLDNFLHADELEDLTFYFHWYLRDSSGQYLVYIESSDLWILDTRTAAAGTNEQKVLGSEFDQKLGTVDVKVTIPIGDLKDSTEIEDIDFAMCIGYEYYYQSGSTTKRIPASVYFGDAKAYASGERSENYVKGESNANFLDKLTIDLDIFDSDTLNIKNCIFRGTLLDTRTQEWMDDLMSSAGEALSLVDIKLRDRFLLYNIARQALRTKIQTPVFYKPLSLWIDSNQNTSVIEKYFVLTGHTYYPETDEMDILLSEYDNTEDINLI